MARRATSSMSRRQVGGGGATSLATSLASATAQGREPMAAENVTHLDTAAGFGRRDDGELEKFGSQTPLRRAGQPAELGSIYVQLTAADASYANGQVYGSAGGSGQS